MTVHVSPSPLLETSGADPAEALSILQGALTGADDGELFLERSESESLVFDDGRLKSAAYDASEGFGLRVVAGRPPATLTPTRFRPPPCAAPPTARLWPRPAMPA